MSGHHRLAEEEEMHRHDLAAPLSRTAPIISLPARSHVPRISSAGEVTERPLAELRVPPVCLATLTIMEAQMTPPPLEIVTSCSLIPRPSSS